MREAINKYGTPIGIFICEVCGKEFTVCPLPKNPDNWKGCLAPACASYDINRDAEVLFMSDEELAQQPVVSLDMVKTRKEGLTQVGKDGGEV